MTLLLYDDIYLKHDTAPYHPENYKRLECTIDHLKSAGLWNKLTLVSPRAATVEEIALVHDRGYISRARKVAEGGGGQLDPDTVLSRDSYQAAIYAAGALLTASDLVMGKKDTNAFCLVRPPGHHARPARGMGFCIFNNAAIAAQYLISRHKLERVLIVDWDCHHGNGTQEIFYNDPRVLYLSLHRWPFYPGTGGKDERGNGEGDGFTINIPIREGTSSEEYIQSFRNVMNGSASAFDPEFIIISAGFDTYAEDPIAGLGLSAKDFATLTKITMDVAKRCSQDRIVSCLEGGYSLQGLPLCIEQHLNALLEIT